MTENNFPKRIGDWLLEGKTWRNIITGEYLPVIQGGGKAVSNQQAFWFRNDDGDETEASWKTTGSNMDVSLNTGLSNRFRLRFVVEETAGGTLNLLGRLFYSYNGGTYTTLTTGSSIIRAIDSINDGWLLTDNDPLTQQMAYPGTYVTGFFSNDGDCANITLDTQHSELEYCLYIYDATGSSTIDIRVYDSAAALDNYNQTPRITVIETAEDLTVTLNELTLSSSLQDITVRDFVPTDIAGLIGWWDFSDIGTLYQDLSKTLFVSSDGDSIAVAEDKSGNNYDQSAPSGTSTSPLYKTAIQNGLSISRFDGSNDWMESSLVTGTSLPITLFAAFSPNSGTLSGDYLFANKISLDWHVIYSTSGNPHFRVYAGLNLSSVEIGLDNFYILTAKYDGSSSFVGVDGTDTSGDVGSQTTFDGVTLASRATPGLYSVSDIGEVIVYDSALSEANILSMEEYLSEKWGVNLAQFITCSTLTLASSVEDITISAVGDLSVVLNELTLASSAQSLLIGTDSVVIHRRQVGRRWIYYPQHIGGEGVEVPEVPTVTLDTLTLSSSAENLTAITPAVVSITLNTLTLSSSAEALTVTPGVATITTNTLTLASSAEAITIGVAAVSVVLNELTLSGSAEAIIITPAIVSITLNELTLASSIEAITVTAGVATIVLSELTLSSSAEIITITPAVVSITLNTLTLSSSAEAINVTIGAISVTLNTLTLASSVEAINISPSAVSVTVNELTLVSSAVSLTVVPAVVSITLNELTLVSSAEALTVVAGVASITLNELTLAGSSVTLNAITPGAVSIVLDTLTLVSSTDGQISIIIGAVAQTVIVNELTLASSVEAITITPAIVSITTNSLTLSSSAEAISIALGAVSVTVSTLTLASSTESITVSSGAVSFSLDTLTLASSVENITITSAAVSVTMDTLTLVSSTETISIAIGAISVSVSTLTLSGSPEAITITPSLVNTVLDTLTLSSTVEQLTIDAPSTITISTLTLASAPQALSAITPSAVSLLMDTLILVATAVSITIQTGALEGLHGVTISDIITQGTSISDALIQDASITDAAIHNVGVTDQNDNS